MRYVLTLLFGERIKGEKVPPPNFHTTYPPVQLSEPEWNEELRPGSQYYTPVKYFPQYGWKYKGK